MDKEIQAVEDMVNIAFHLGRKTRKKWTKAEKKSHEVIQMNIKLVQAKLMGYKALQQAVVLSKCKKKISDDAQKFVTAMLKEVKGGK